MTIQQELTQDADVPEPNDAREPGKPSFEEFVHATGARIYRSALLLCGDHHLAEDLTQITYTKVFVAWSKASVAHNPVAYTHKVLLRTFFSHRRLKRSAESPVQDLPGSPTADGPDLGVRLDLLAALRRLPPSDRAVLVLRYCEDKSVAQTAELLGIREGACRARSARALARLRADLPELIEANYYDPEDLS